MRLVVFLFGLLLAPSLAWAADRFDTTPRTAVVSAFPPELAALEAATTGKVEHAAAGTRFVTGTLEGRPVVLFLSGVSMVNAAMTTQQALDRFAISAIVFSGIAGGVDPTLDVGDVVVADQWGQSLEMAFAREIPGGFSPPQGEHAGMANFQMMFPRAVLAAQTPGQVEKRLWFPADPALLAIAHKAVEGVALQRCAADRCLIKTPKVVVGGNGVSGPAFVDNAGYRQYVFATYQARVIDMESAAVAQVAWVNKTPFIAFRSLSDLAGGDPAANQFPIFLGLASENSATVVRAFLKALP
ncbi:MAG: phosphorylase [Caulobacter sp.]|nr:phosphorylase [Caulobacter sp.]